MKSLAAINIVIAINLFFSGFNENKKMKIFQMTILMLLIVCNESNKILGVKTQNLTRLYGDF